jgi:outer membrane PBP1 activator LpoA protein
MAAAAAFLQRSAALTLDPARRAERAVAAAQVWYQAGAFDAAEALLAAAEEGPSDQLRRARTDLLRGQIAFASSRGSDAPPLLLKAARQFEPLDPRLARETYLDALAAAAGACVRTRSVAGRLGPADPRGVWHRGAGAPRGSGRVPQG